MLCFLAYDLISINVRTPQVWDVCYVREQPPDRKTELEPFPLPTFDSALMSSVSPSGLSAPPSLHTCY